MAEHYAEGQYDDDLTVGLDDLTDEGYFEEDDLLKYQSSEDESPLARLKSLVLSIDWEITDDVLRQFNEELIHLRDLWDGESVYLVYVQALGTISKYIYQKKTSAHHNAIKLLPLLYNNLEKVVHDEQLDDEGRQQILLADVSRFNELKEQIAGNTTKENVDVVLRKVKAIVLSIDWEITKSDLEQLGVEVSKLELAFKKNKPCLIMLQGIGTLAAYIQHKAGNAHPDAFILIHDFYLALEKLLLTKLPSEQEKKILFAEVEKFNAFKKVIASTISPEALKRDATGSVEEDEKSLDTSSVQPAFADVEPDKVSGFQEEQEASELEQEVDISAKLERFFADTSDEDVADEGLQSEAVAKAIEDDNAESVVEEAESRLEDFFDDTVSENSENIDKATALQGVDVETEADDDSDEDALPVMDGKLAPALVDDGDQQSSFSEGALASADNEWEEPGVGFLDDEADVPVDENDKDIVVDEDSSIDFIDETEDFTAALADVKGVDVETEADDDSDEPPLLFEGEALAPALAGFGTEDEQSEDDETEFEDQLGIDNTLDAFFGEDEEDVKDESASEEVDLLKEYFDEDFDESSDVVPGETNEEFAAIASEVVDEQDEDIESSVDEFFGVDSTDESIIPSEETDDSIDGSVEDFFADEEESFEPVAELSDIENSSAEEGLEDDVEDVVAVAPALAEVAPAFDSTAESEDASFEDTVEESIDDFFAVGDEEENVMEAESIEDVISDSDFQDDDSEAELLTEPDESEMSSSSIGDVVASSSVAAVVSSTDIGDDERIEDDVVDDSSSLSKEALISETENEYLVEFIEVDEDTPETALFEALANDPYEGLRGCVQSLGIEINDQIIDGLMIEINQMRQQMVSEPLGKSFLQLMSTIAQHISRYQFSSGAGAYELLISVLDGMEKGLSGSVADGQEIFLAEMYKVLNWQQNIMTQQSVSDVEEISDTAVESPAIEEIHEKTELFNEGDDELLYAVLEEEMAETEEASSSDVGVEGLRSELQSLRQTLQEEIAQLRADLTK